MSPNETTVSDDTSKEGSVWRFSTSILNPPRFKGIKKVGEAIDGGHHLQQGDVALRGRRCAVVNYRFARRLALRWSYGAQSHRAFEVEHREGVHYSPPRLWGCERRKSHLCESEHGDFPQPGCADWFGDTVDLSLWPAHEESVGRQRPP